MPRAANDVMQSILFSAVLDALAGLKAASGGVPNNMLRDVQSIHPNTTFADLPKPVQDAIVASTRSAFTALLKEGYAVGPKEEIRRSTPLDRVPERDRERRGPGPDRRFVRKTPGRRGPGGGGGVVRGGRPPKGGGSGGSGGGGSGGGGGGKGGPQG